MIRKSPIFSSLSFAALLLSTLALSFSSCGGSEGNTPSAQTETLQMAFDELTLAQGETMRLYCRAASGNAVTLTWSSDKPEVASVDNIGNVTANAAGTAVITAAAGEAKAQCTISVTASALAKYTFPNAALLGEPDTEYFKSDIIHTKMGKDSVHLYLSMAHVLLLSDGLYLNADAELDGSAPEGAVISLEVPMYYGPAGINNGRPVIVNLFDDDINISSEQPATEPYNAQYGSINKNAYISAIKTYCECSNSGNKDGMYSAIDNATKAISGARVSLVVYHSREEGYPVNGYVMNDLPEGLVASGKVKLTRKGVNDFTNKVTSIDIIVKPLDKTPDHYYGSALTYDPAKGYYLADDDIHYLTDIRYTK